MEKKRLECIGEGRGSDVALFQGYHLSYSHAMTENICVTFGEQHIYFQTVHIENAVGKQATMSPGNSAKFTGNGK